MTPQANTLFAICLFLALCALNSWTVRRDRKARRSRAVAGMLGDGEAVQA